MNNLTELIARQALKELIKEEQEREKESLAVLKELMGEHEIDLYDDN